MVVIKQTHITQFNSEKKEIKRLLKPAGCELGSGRGCWARGHRAGRAGWEEARQPRARTPVWAGGRGQGGPAQPPPATGGARGAGSALGHVRGERGARAGAGAGAGTRAGAGTGTETGTMARLRAGAAVPRARPSSELVLLLRATTGVRRLRWAGRPLPGTPHPPGGGARGRAAGERTLEPEGGGLWCEARRREARWARPGGDPGARGRLPRRQVLEPRLRSGLLAVGAGG